MRRIRALSAAVVALIGLVGTVPSASAAGPPEDLVTVVGPIVEAVDCDGSSITTTISGWVGLPTSADVSTFYHLDRTYSNADGNTWMYIDTGVVRTFERDGDVYVSLSGRSVNVGPGDTGWIGHWELNTFTSEVTSAGLGAGDVDQIACSLLGFA
jgi:hypothetical protein